MTDDPNRTEQPRNPDGTFAEGSQGHLVHGGAGALSRIRDGKEFIGLAAQEEKQVQAEIDAEGVLPVIAKGARRLETAARLYWNAVQAASERGDLDALTAFIKVFGWLQASAIRSLSAVREAQKDGDPGGDAEHRAIIAKYSEVKDDDHKDS